MKISALQKAKLASLLTSKPQLRQGKVSPSFTRKDAAREWATIAAILNAIPGAHKDWKTWRKTWQDIQSKVKAKTAIINKARRGTGAGLPPDPLNIFEESVAAGIHPRAISGHSGVFESVVVFEASSEPRPIKVEIVESEGIIDADLCPPHGVEADFSVLPSLPQFETAPAKPREADFAILPPPPQFETAPAKLQYDTTPAPAPQTAQRKKKINLKSLLKEKLEMKKEELEAKKNFYKDFISNMERQTKAMEAISNALNK